MAEQSVGRRIAGYRKLAALTAQELADRAGDGLTRSVIANIESGRKVDVTVLEIFAIARALNVPPLSLLVDTSAPDAPTEYQGMAGLTNAEFMEWITGELTLPAESPNGGYAELIAQDRLVTIRLLRSAREQAERLRRMVAMRETHAITDEALATLNLQRRELETHERTIAAIEQRQRAGDDG